MRSTITDREIGERRAERCKPLGVVLLSCPSLTPLDEWVARGRRSVCHTVYTVDCRVEVARKLWARSKSEGTRRARSEEAPELGGLNLSPGTL